MPAQIEDKRINPELDARYVAMLDALIDERNNIVRQDPKYGFLLDLWMMQCGKSGLEMRVLEGTVECFVDNSGEVSYRLTEG